MCEGRAMSTGIFRWPNQRLSERRTGNCGLKQTSLICLILLILQTLAQRSEPGALVLSAVLGCRRGTFNLDLSFRSDWVGRRSLIFEKGRRGDAPLRCPRCACLFFCRYVLSARSAFYNQT